MQFNIFAVEVNNFKCFYGSHLYEFPTNSGLFYLTGRNRFNKRLGANAVGKTSLIDSIEWCLYGKTSRGLRAGDVVSWGKKGCSVTVSLLIGDQEVQITRTQSPNSLSIDEKAVSQEEVTALLRLNQEAFNSSVILPQFGSSFFDLQPTQKLSLFSQVMNLQYWMDKSDLAKSRAADVEAIIEKLATYIAKVEGKLDHARTDLKDLRVKEQEHVEKQKEKINVLQNEINELLEKVNGLLSKVKKFTKTASEIDKSIEEVDAAVKECNTEFEKAGDRVRDLKASVSSYNRSIDDINTEIKEVVKLKGDVCPECRQRVDDTHVEGHKAKLSKKRSKLIEERDKDAKSLGKAETKLSEFRTDLNGLVRLRRELDAEKAQAKDEIKSAQRSLTNIEESSSRCKADIAKLKKQENPFTSMITARRKAIRGFKDEIKVTTRELNKKKKKYEAVSYWINGFKKVRLFVVEDALLALEVEINNLLVALGMPGWKITLDVERENKSGGITKGFSVFIHSPKHDKPVRWESWSGGETQRLRLAGNLGLANLIMEQAGYENKIEIMDEPSEHMSPEGIEDMIETLYERAQTTNRQIWLVDHRTMDFGGFSGILTAVMDKKGKAILEYQDRS